MSARPDAIEDIAGALVAALRDEIARAMPTDPPLLLNVTEAARLAGISRTTMYESVLDKPGGIEAFRLPTGARLVRREDLLAWVQGRKARP